MTSDNNLPMDTMEFHLEESLAITDLDTYKKFPFSDISGLGAIFSELSPTFRTITKKTTANVKGLYKCRFPEGVQGYLARFKGSKDNLGTIINKSGFAGQAHWTPVNKVSATEVITAPINPISVFIAAELMEMNHKLDDIKALGEEILSYQKDKDRAAQEANYEELINIYRNYQYNLDDKNWQTVKDVLVQRIRLDTSARIKQLQLEISKALDKHDIIHYQQQSKEMIQKVQENFILYRLAVYMYSFATFLETLFEANFSAEYLSSIQKDIHKVATDYFSDYTKAFSILEHSSNTTVLSNLLNGFATVAKGTGEIIHQIPFIEKGPVDEWLISAGDSINGLTKEQTEKALKQFKENYASGAKQFSDAIEDIKELYNNPVTVMIDDNNMYLKIDHSQNESMRLPVKSKNTR